MPVTTLTERKRAEAARIERAARSALEDLRSYAHDHGGCFVAFGSVVSGHIRYDSDLDLMIDFPPDASGDAWSFAEDLAARYDLRLDIHDAAKTKSDFVDAVRARGVTLR